MNKKLREVSGNAGHWSTLWLLLGSLWAPALWLTVVALGDGSNLVDPPSERYFRQEVVYPVLSLLTAAAFVNLSLWLVRRRFPRFTVTLWISSVGILGLLLFGGGLLMVGCEGADIFSCPGSQDITRFTLVVSGLMASVTLPGWMTLGVSYLNTAATRGRSGVIDEPDP